MWSLGGLGQRGSPYSGEVGPKRAEEKAKRGEGLTRARLPGFGWAGTAACEELGSARPWRPLGVVVPVRWRPGWATSGPGNSSGARGRVMGALLVTALVAWGARRAASNATHGGALGSRVRGMHGGVFIGGE
jgi:hypothetical protein